MFRVFQPILFIFDKFLLVFSEIFHHRVLGHVYLSRRVYLALYGSFTTNSATVLPISLPVIRENSKTSLEIPDFYRVVELPIISLSLIASV